LKAVTELRKKSDKNLLKALDEVNLELSKAINIYAIYKMAGYGNTMMKRNLRKRKARILTILGERGIKK